MYLSKFVMNKEHPSAKQAMKNVQDFHRNLMTYFQNSRQEAGVLYRTNFLTKNPIVYVSSKIPPKNIRQGFMDLLESRSIDSYVESLSNGKIFSFDICTIPCKKVVREGKKNSARITLGLEVERIEWLQRKAEGAGFRILAVQEMECSETYGKKKAAGYEMYLKGYHYQGQLIVDDEKKFRQAYCDGIGPDKAYGYGMLLLV